MIAVTPERTEDIGIGTSGQGDSGLMLTGDENIVDIDFQVVWNISDAERYLFNLRDPELTINAVAESSMREITVRSQLAPILNRDRGVIAERLKTMIQSTPDSYDSGLNVVRVNSTAPIRRASDRGLQERPVGRTGTRPPGNRGRRLCQHDRRRCARPVGPADGRGRSLPCPGREPGGRRGCRFTAVLGEYQKAPGGRASAFTSDDGRVSLAA